MAKKINLDPVKIAKYAATHTPEETADCIVANINYYQNPVKIQDDGCNGNCTANQFCDKGKCYDKLGS